MSPQSVYGGYGMKGSGGMKPCGGKEMSTNNCYKLMLVFIVFPGFSLKKL